MPDSSHIARADADTVVSPELNDAESVLLATPRDGPEGDSAAVADAVSDAAPGTVSAPAADDEIALTEAGPGAEQGAAQGGGMMSSSGVGSYKHQAGDLVGSVARLDSLETFQWGQDPDRGLYAADVFFPSSGGSVAALTSSPDVALGFLDGANYPAPHIVMEGDPYGILLEIRLSSAPSGSGGPGLAGSNVIVLEIGGTAQMAGKNGMPTATDDYEHWTAWTINTPVGSFSATRCMAQVSPGVFSLTLPDGVTEFSIQVPLIDNLVSQPDRTFTYRVMSSGGYFLTSGESGTITIVDESRAQEINPGFVPTPGGQDGGVFLWGPTARIQVHDGSSWTDSRTVMENDGSPVQYRFQLVDTQTGKAFTPAEDIAITISITGRKGMVLDSASSKQDFDLSGLLATFQAKYPDAAYNEASGQLTFTIPAGVPAVDVVFTGIPISDSRNEARADGSLETVHFTVTCAEGSETLLGGGASTSLIDMPVVSVAASSAAFSESANHPLGNSVDFAFSLSSSVPGRSTTVNLDWTTGTTATTADYTWVLNGVARKGPLPSSITFGPGDSKAVITITAIDDKLTEGAESVRVAILPENHPGPATEADNYHVSTGSGAAASTLYDDTDSIYGGGEVP